MKDILFFFVKERYCETLLIKYYSSFLFRAEWFFATIGEIALLHTHNSSRRSSFDVLAKPGKKKPLYLVLSISVWSVSPYW